MSASAPQARFIEPEPPDWQPRAIWVGGRLLCGSISFFFASFVFRREPAEVNPWYSRSAEWQLPTPVPLHDFDRLPVFDEDPYPYGVEPVPAVPVVAPAGGSV